MLTPAIWRLADNTDPRSLASALRLRRFGFFRSLLGALPRPLRVLDVGGTQRYWIAMGFRPEPGVTVTLLNTSPQPATDPGFFTALGDARNMPFGDQQFDVVFSNSVIEHVGTYSDQRSMAREIARVGRRFFVQTPNRYFLLEPHFLVPGFQFLPLHLRAWLHARTRLGWMPRAPDFSAALAAVRQIRLLSRTRDSVPGSSDRTGASARTDQVLHGAWRLVFMSHREAGTADESLYCLEGTCGNHQRQ